MQEEKLKEFASQLDADTDIILDRWQGQPDNIIEDIFRVRDIDTGEVRDLELFDVQRKVIHAYFYGDASTMNLYKGRRIGYSFAVVACFLLEGIFYPDSYYPLVSRSLSQSKDRIDDIQSLIDHAKVEIPTVKENTDYIELWNGSAFQAYSSESDTSRGDDSARAVLLDEMAFMEDETAAYRAFGAFLVLGQNRKMVEVSTPNTKNDLFMQEHRRGSPDGENGVLSIKQPSLANAEQIDVNASLYDQEVIPVRPDMNVDHLETERLSDPQGFGQEYLCRPVVDEYRFFDEDSIIEAQQRGAAPDYEIGFSASKRGGRRIMGIDVGIEHDDTVISVMDHYSSGERRQRLLMVVTEDILHQNTKVRFPDPGNANHVAQLVNVVHSAMDVDATILDKGGVGQTFERIIERKLGREVVGFDFSDNDAVVDMFGDTNVCLRQGDMTLIDNDRLYDEMQAIVKEKSEYYSTPRYSGKDNSESGKDDTAIATVLSAFPPKISSSPATRPAEKPREIADKPAQRHGHQVENALFGDVVATRVSRDRTDEYSPRHARYR